MKIQDIVSDCSELLEVLSDNLLNKLLSKEKPILFADYGYPTNKSIYIDRRLHFVNRNVNLAKNIISDDNDMYKKLSGELFYEMLSKRRTKVCRNSDCPLHRRADRTQKVHFHGENSGQSADVFSESDFLLKVYLRNIKTVYLLAESGMGKSKLLVSLGNKMKNSLVIFSTFRYFIDLLKKRVGTTECSKADIKNVISEMGVEINVKNM